MADWKRQLATELCYVCAIINYNGKKAFISLLVYKLQHLLSCYGSRVGSCYNTGTTNLVSRLSRREQQPLLFENIVLHIRISYVRHLGFLHRARHGIGR